MGVKSGGKLLHSVDDVSFDNLLTILRYRAKERGPDAIPMIAANINWLARKHSSKRTSVYDFILAILKPASVKEIPGATGPYCMPCLASATGVGDKLETDDELHVAEMRTALLTENVHDIADFSVAEVQELYDALVNGKHTQIEGLDQVKFPLLLSSALDDDEAFSGKVPFQLCDGAHFLQATELSDSAVAGIIRILAELLTFSNLNDTTQEVYRRGVPNLVAKFAEGSRLNGGNRLMKRANRHAMDPRSPPLQSATGAVCLRDDNALPALMIAVKVRASMKSEAYDTHVCFSVDDLISCSCTCKARSQGPDKVVCVHTLSVVEKFAVFLLDGLAEHALHALAARWPAGRRTRRKSQSIHSIDSDCTLRNDLLRLLSVVSASKHSGTVDSEKVVSWRSWHTSDGTSPILPKMLGEGVMVSAFTGFVTGFGGKNLPPLTDEVLEAINGFRMGEHSLHPQAWSINSDFGYI